MFSHPTTGFALWGDTAASTYHQFARLHSLSEWWQWLLLMVICVAVVAYVTVLYRRDTVEMRGGVAWSLLLLRLAAFGGILFFYLDLERRTEHKLVKNSRVHLLVDTSQSMGLQDQDSRGTATKSRIEQVTAELANGELIKKLRDLRFFVRAEKSVFTQIGGACDTVNQRHVHMYMHLPSRTVAAAKSTRS